MWLPCFGIVAGLAILVLLCASLPYMSIVCGYVSSEAANHAWNAVYLNNQWYHMDATWDDPTWDNLGRVGARI